MFVADGYAPPVAGGVCGRDPGATHAKTFALSGSEHMFIPLECCEIEESSGLQLQLFRPADLFNRASRDCVEVSRSSVSLQEVVAEIRRLG